MDSVCDLSKGTCQPCEGDLLPMADAEVARILKQLDGWSQVSNSIVKTWHFTSYCETIAFVNATAWISHREEHHPDLAVGYNTCTVTYTTHAIGGLSENDFICASKIEGLFAI